MKNSDFDALINAAKSGDEKIMEKMGNIAASKLSDDSREKINKALNDPEYLKNILTSEKAKQILKQLQGRND